MQARILDHDLPVDDLLRRSAKGEGPAVAMVPGDHLDALAAVEAIVPLEDCLVAAGLDNEPYLPAALRAGQLDGVQWGLPANVDAHYLVYDRAALARAGLDPDRPPGTLAELERAAVALRESGFEHPVALGFLADLVVTSGLTFREGARAGFAGPEGEELADAIGRLGAAGLLAPQADGEEALPPIGAGTVAIQDIDLGGIWGLAEALAAGQAPGRDLDIAPLPGVDRPGVPVLGRHMLVLGADVPARTRSAAWRFLLWLQRPENMADLHLASDLLPTRTDAVADAALDAYWDRLPLFRRAWEELQAHPAELPAGTTFPGATGIVHRALAGIADEGAPSGALDRALADVTAAVAAHDRDPRSYLQCMRDDGGPRCWQ